ncbi:MAG TPA: hypothetical protein VF691_14320 [Cytophagaceae bacterium]
MKNITISFQACLLSFFVMIILSCSKDRITPIATEVPRERALDSTELFLASPDEVLKGFTSPPTSKIINSSVDMPFIGTKGTKIFASDYDFIFPNGDPVIFPIKLEILELFSPKDMILNQMPTVANGRLLTTAGEVNIKAYKDGKELKLKRYNNMRIEIPSSNPDASMKLFYGRTLVDGHVDWVEAEFISESDCTSSRIIATKENYQIFPKQIGWINCDKFYSYTGAKTKIRFTSAKPQISSIVTFLYFDEIKSVVQVHGGESLDLPVGEHVKVICVASKTNGELYTYSTDFNVAPDQVVEVKLAKTTEGRFLEYLSSL